jgi:hypothetical protein
MLFASREVALDNVQDGNDVKDDSLVVLSAKVVASHVEELSSVDHRSDTVRCLRGFEETKVPADLCTSDKDGSVPLLRRLPLSMSGFSLCVTVVMLLLRVSHTGRTTWPISRTESW